MALVRNEETETEKAKVSDKVREWERGKRDGVEERDVEEIQGTGTENQEKEQCSDEASRVLPFGLGKKK